MAPLGEISKLQMKRKSDSDMLDLGLGLASTSSSKPIKVYTKEKRQRKDSETLEPARPSSSGMFETVYDFDAFINNFCFFVNDFISNFRSKI